jgi:DNA-binding SARP family transcriptional activator
MAVGLEFRILGPLEVSRDGNPVTIGARRRRTLLGLLLLRANEPVSLEQLIEELWSGRPPHAAKASVHNQVAALRKVLGPDVIETHPSGYRISVDSRQLDLARFEALVAEARSAEWGARATKLREALAEWRGAPLADLPCDGLQTETVRLEELRLIALEERIESELALGLNAELVPELESLVERHPLRERLWGHLMTALYRSGRQADALATYRRAHATLVAELGIEPSPALKKLQRAILVHDRRLAEPEGSAPDELLERIAPLLPTPDERSRARAVFEYGHALWLLGERDRSEAALEKSADMAAVAGDRGLEELARLQLSWHALFTKRGSTTAHLERARRARRVFEENDDRTNLARAFQHEGFMLRDLGRAAEGAAAFTRGAELAHEVGDAAQEFACRDQACFALYLGPMPVEQVIERCEAESEVVKRLGRSPIFGWWALGLVSAQLGEPARGLAYFETAEAACRDAELWNQLALTSFFRSGIYELTEDWASAERELRSAFEQFDAIADRGMLQLLAGRLARVLVQTEKPDEAEELSRRASGAGDPGDFSEQVAWRQGLALVEARLGRHAPALEVAREAVDLAARSDWLNLRAETLEDLAAVEASAGHTALACSALDEAIALYERKGNRVARERAVRTSERVRERAAAVR